MSYTKEKVDALIGLCESLPQAKHRHIHSLIGELKQEIGSHGTVQTAYDRFNEWVKTHTPAVYKMSKPFTPAQIDAMMKMGSSSQVKAVLYDMENHKDLNKKYTSAFTTFRNWFNRAYGVKNETTTKRSRYQDLKDAAQRTILDLGTNNDPGNN